MSNNSNKDANQFKDDELYNEERENRHLTKASFFDALKIQKQTTEEACVAKQECGAEELKLNRINGQRGGNARAKTWSPIREFVRYKAAQQSGSSRSQIAEAIAPDVLKYADELGVKMSRRRAEKTICEWLKQDEDRLVALPPYK